MKGYSWGLFIIIGVLAYSLGGSKLLVFLNPHAIVLVGFGTIASLVLSASLRDLKTLRKLFASLFFKKEPDSELIRKSILDLSTKKTAKTDSDHPLIAYAKDLWERGMDAKTFKMLLVQRVNEIQHSNDTATAHIRNLAKYPPALGMIGTVIGLISLFSDLTSENKGNLGPSLALAMTATFYGLVIANMLIMPLADRLQAWSNYDLQTNQRIVQALLMIQEGQPDEVIEERLYESTHAA